MSGIIRTCIHEVIRSVASGRSVSAKVVFSGRGLGFALAVGVTRNGDTFNATIATAAGVGPAATYSGEAAVLEANLVEVLSEALQNAKGTLIGELSAEVEGDAPVVPVARITSDDGTFRFIDEPTLNFISAAVKRSLAALTRGESKEADLKVEAHGRQWPTWILMDRTETGFDAMTNDVDLMCGEGPSFFLQKNDEKALHDAIVQFLSADFVDAGSVTVLIRLDRVNLVGDSNEGVIREQE